MHELPDHADHSASHLIDDAPMALAPPIAPPEVERTAEAQSTSPQAIAQPVHHAGGVRIVIVAWSFWLLGCWAISSLIDQGLPRIRWMLLTCVLGLMLAWPALRLSQRPDPKHPGTGAGQALLDWLAMILVFQAVLWSLHIIAHWPADRSLWLDGGIAAWTLLTALVVGWARTTPGWVTRIIAMILCIALALGWPMWQWITAPRPVGTTPIGYSPLHMIWALTHRPDQAPTPPWDQQIIVVAFIAALGWLALGAIAWAKRRANRTQAKPGHAESDMRESPDPGNDPADITRP